MKLIELMSDTLFRFPKDADWVAFIPGEGMSLPMVWVDFEKNNYGMTCFIDDGECSAIRLLMGKNDDLMISLLGAVGAEVVTREDYEKTSGGMIISRMMSDINKRLDAMERAAINKALGEKQ